MRVAPYTLVSDVRHAWLAVPIEELRQLGIYADISDYSPEAAGMRFLEGDCDMELYYRRLEALRKARPDILHLEVHDFREEVLNRR